MLTWPRLAEMQATMLERYNLRASEVRLSGENLAQLQHDNFRGSPLPVRYTTLPTNTIEFFVPEARNLLGGHDRVFYEGMVTARWAPQEIEGQMFFTFDGVTFTCRITAEPYHGRAVSRPSRIRPSLGFNCRASLQLRPNFRRSARPWSSSSLP